MATPKTKPVTITKDPDNPQTVILSRWPTEKEKTQAFREKVREVRRQR